MVRAAVSGALRVLEVEIEPQLVEHRDREMIQDLTAAAINGALELAEKSVQAEMQRFQGNMLAGVLPGLGKMR